MFPNACVSWCRLLAFAALMVFLPFGIAADPPDDSRNSDFERDIAPLLLRHCLDCHQPNKLSGELNLSSLGGLLAGGEQGPAIERGNPEASLLLRRIQAGEMPPPDAKEHRPLTPAEFGRLQQWIAAGAPWPQDRVLGIHEKPLDLAPAREFWSFRTVSRPAIPAVQRADRVANPIDAFVWRELESRQLQMAEPVAASVLLRRVSLDLRGLPPTLDEQQRFLDDQSPDAYGRLVDRLLNEPSHGERWGRHWLDLVRYADSSGYERDAPKPSVWQYRDYVIRALNEDKPYDRFVVEQLAGDELPEETFDSLVATGFHALGTWQDEVDPLEAAQYRADELDDMIRVTSQTFLGITVGCARCHHHKFDPLTMVDYYSLAAILAPLKRPNQGRQDRDLPVAPRARIADQELRDQAIAECEREVESLLETQAATWFASGKSRIERAAQVAWLALPDQRTPEQQQLVRQHRAALLAELRAALPSLSEAVRQQVAALQEKQQSLRKDLPDLPRAYRLFEDSPNAPATHLLLSGRASNPGPVMQPRVPAVLAPTQPDFPSTGIHSTLRRRTLAQWIASPDNPLTARVIVNRVWQHHFGTGIVATSSDFGHIGSRPSHPELLDWLAHWFMHDAGWSLKQLHRLIVTSETYRQSAQWDERAAMTDPRNQLLWRYPYRRLDVESIRDSMLAVSGALNARMYGPGVFLPIPDVVVEAHTDQKQAWQPSPEPEIDRRTIYAYLRRTLMVPMLEALDFCDTTQSTERRAITSVAPQALTLMNGEFVNRQAEYFARRLELEAGPEDGPRIELAYRLALARSPTAGEMEVLLRFLDGETQLLARGAPAGQSAVESGTVESGEVLRHRALVQLCRAMLNLNEFVYLD